MVRRGKVRRAKLYYLRERQGKSARIAERTTGRLSDKNTKSSKKKESGPEAKPDISKKEN